MIEVNPFKSDLASGEADPRSYHLFCKAKLSCDKIGSHERLQQVNKLTYFIDHVLTAGGYPRFRIHYTVEPGVDAKEAIEAHIQLLDGEAAGLRDVPMVFGDQTFAEICARDGITIL